MTPRMLIVLATGLLAGCSRSPHMNPIAGNDSFGQTIYTAAARQRLEWLQEYFKPLIAVVGDGGDLTIHAGNEQRQYQAFAWEVVAVRRNPRDGYPCPVVHRWLLAWPRHWDRRSWLNFDALLISGADFSQPIKLDRHWCAEQAGATPSQPVVEFLERGLAKQEGVSGRASMEPQSTAGRPCRRRPPGATDLRTECALGQFIVALETDVAPVAWAGSDSLAVATVTGARLPIRIDAQRVPGFRVRVFCDITERPRQGCTWYGHDREVSMADADRQDAIERAAYARRDSVEQAMLRRVDSIGKVMLRHDWLPQAAAQAFAAGLKGGVPLDRERLAGRWDIVTLAADTDTAVAIYPILTTDSREGWSVTLPGRDPLPVAVLELGGDSVVFEIGPFQSLLRPDQTVTTHAVAHLVHPVVMVGRMVARFSSGDSLSQRLYGVKQDAGPHNAYDR